MVVVRGVAREDVDDDASEGRGLLTDDEDDEGGLMDGRRL
jgi:hypothetical protein